MAVSTVKYLLRTDVHTFAFSVAANSILSFFPFVVLLMTLIRRVFHSRVMGDVVVELLRDYLPAGQEFVIRNLNAMVTSRQQVQIVVTQYGYRILAEGAYEPQDFQGLRAAVHQVAHEPELVFVGGELQLRDQRTQFRITSLDVTDRVPAHCRIPGIASRKGWIGASKRCPSSSIIS